MQRILIGVGLNLLVAVFSCYFLIEISDVAADYAISAVIFIFWLASLAGSFLALAGKRTSGCVLVTIGSIPFIPVGVFAIYAAAKYKEPSKEDLNIRRQAITEQAESRLAVDLAATGCMEEHSRVFKARRQSSINTLIGVAMLAFGFILLSEGGGSMPITLGILAIVTAVIHYQADYVVIGEDYISIKPGPLRSRVDILFDEVVKVSKRDNNIMVSYKFHRSQATWDKDIYINLKWLEETDRTELLSVIDECFSDKLGKQVFTEKEPV